MKKSAIIKNNFVFCYPILEDNKSKLLKKIEEVDTTRNSMIELRLDYLLYAGMSIDEIIKLINHIKTKVTHKKLIATIRTVSEGGRVDLTKEKYYYFIKELYLKSRVHYIDVEYKFYKIDKLYYDLLFKKKRKKIITSIHIFDRLFFENEYLDLFSEMAKASGDIIKFAINVYSKEDLFTFMITAKRAHSFLKKNKKKCIFIAMGDIGRLSRLWPEFTSTIIVFLNAYAYDDKKMGQMSKVYYLKLRKWLAKISKN